MLSLLKNKSMLMALAFLLGIFIQCVSLLRQKPKKLTVLAFIGMLICMIFMMAGSLTYYSAEYLEKHLKEAIIPQFFSLGFIFAFLFISFFLKEVIKIINEKVIFSLTLSYWFLLLTERRIFSNSLFLLLIAIGLIASIGIIHLVLTDKKLKELQKFLYYGWFLFINALLAYSYLAYLPKKILMSGGLIVSGEENCIQMLCLGMIIVHIMFNAGILYYSIIHSLISKEVRKQLLTYSDSLFTDHQTSREEIITIIGIQIFLFFLFAIAEAVFRFYLITLWMLLTPVIILAVSYIRKRIQKP